MPSPFASADAMTVIVPARVPLVTVVRAKPKPSLMTSIGLSVSSPSPVNLNFTFTPASGLAFGSVTLKVRMDCSGRPDWRTPLCVGCGEETKKKFCPAGGGGGGGGGWGVVRGVQD